VASSPSKVALLLEREPALDRLRAGVAAAREGTGRLLLLEGDPGVGKTALLAAAADIAGEAGLEVLTARGGELEAAGGFGVVQQLLERIVVGAGGEEREGLLAGAAALAATPLGLAPAGQPPLDPTQARHGLYWLLANLAELRPVALLVDDAQWADQPSLDWLLYLVRRIERLPVLVVVAQAPGEPVAARPLLDALALEPATATLPLAPLSEAGTAAALAALDGGTVEEAFARACHDWTGGNPHFVAETAAELAAEGLAPGPEATARLRSLAPERVAAVTQLRLGRLSAEAGELAAALAVLGGEAPLDRAARLAGLSREAAVAAADELAGARFVSVAPRLRFLQPLIGRAVYEKLGEARRDDDHGRAAHLLADGDAGSAAVAAHLLHTAPAGDPWAVGWLRAAAAEELGRGSATAAVPLLRRALAEPPEAEEVAGIQTMLGLAEAVAGDPAGLDSLRAGFEAAAGPARAAAALLLARFLVYAGRGGEVVERVEPVLAQLAEDDELRLRLEAALITAARADRGLREVADEHLGRVRAWAAEDSPAGRVVAVQCAYAAAAAGDPVAEAVAFARAALGGGRLLDEEPLSPDIYLIPLSMLAICDELEEAAAGFEDALDRAGAGGSPLAYAATAAISSWTAILRGRLDQGELLARDALRIAGESPGLEALRGFAGVHLALASIEQGAPAAALELLGPDIGAYTDSPHTWSREALFAFGRARLALREPEAALAALLACGELSESFGIVNPAFLAWRSAAATALRELGDGDRATELAAEEVELARRFGAPRPLGIALRAAGLVRGGEEGIALLGESAAVLADSPARLERAHTLLALGGALRQGGRRADSREPLAAGLDLAEACGAAPLAEAAREELAAGGVRVRAGGRWDADALTPSELRTSRMAADGLSNPAIAQALFVTRATVESHLHAAYRKLGISSRAALPQALREYD
jgi:DNA-binding CsgD family transcriptional regulator